MTEDQNIIAFNLGITVEWMDELMEVLKKENVSERDIKPFKILKSTMTAAIDEITRLDTLLHKQNVKNLEKGLDND